MRAHIRSLGVAAMLFGLGACGTSPTPAGNKCVLDSDCGDPRFQCLQGVCIGFIVGNDGPGPGIQDMTMPNSMVDFSHDLTVGPGCPFGTRECGVQGTNPPKPRCIPNGYCCTNNDCQAANQTCQIDGTCQCPKGQKACVTQCIASTSCCTNDDCPSKLCNTANLTCAVPSCNDGVINGAETDIDCGGGFCPKCLNNRTCSIAIDCRSNACVSMKCSDSGFIATPYGGANGPIWVTTADLNGDKIPDVATANITSNNASILLGRGDGNFNSIGSFGAGLSPVMITNGDLNGDSRPDLVVVNQGSYDITVLIGNGDGTFAPGVSYGVGATPTWATIADVNGDRRLDVIVANSITNTISVLLGKGDGKFNAKVDYSTDINPRAVEAGDLNGDGLADLVVACRNSSRISILLNKSSAGLMGFSSFISIVSTIGPNALAIADFNGDKKLDVIAGSAGSGSQVFLGGGNGQIVLAGPIGSGIHNELIPIDVNNDKILDLVTTNGLLLGNGNGSFQVQIAFPTYSNLTSIGIADFTPSNKDGKLDLVLPQQGASTVVSQWGNQDGTFQTVNAMLGMVSGSITDVTLLQPRFVRLSDLNGDGRDDLLTTSNTNAQLWVQIANANGSLQLPSVYTTCANPSSIAIGDFNEDKNVDAILGCASANNAIMYAGSANGSLTPVVPVMGMPPVIQTPNMTVAQAADMDKDTHVDLVYSDNTGVKVMFGKGDGTFRNNPQAAANGGGLGNSRTLQIIDWNGDGYLDIVTANGTSTSVALSKGADMNGAFLGFNAGVNVALGNAAKSSAAWAADINGDQAPDVIVSDNSNAATPRVQVLLNANAGQGNLTFKPNPINYIVSSAPIWMVMADFNGDKLLDVATANSLDRSVSTLAGKKDGTFEKLLTHDVGVGPIMIATGDINGDGKPDLVTANQTSNTMTVLINVGGQ